MIGFTQQENIEDAAEMGRMFLALDRLPMPLIGRVHGAALGGGAGLCAVCDIVVAAEDAVFGFTEVKLGIIPAVISPFVLAKIGRSAARELFLTGARFSAARAREIGLVHAVVPAAELDEKVAALRPRAADLRTRGDRGGEGAHPRGCEARPGRGHRAHVGSDRTAAGSAEGQEGLRAFLEKRRAGLDREGLTRCSPASWSRIAARSPFA